jgi:5-methylcytosine-specific restriction endonuclease McrA
MFGDVATILYELFWAFTELFGVGRRLSPARRRFIYSKAFLRSAEWQKVRYAALKLHGGRCQCCGRGARERAVINVDHIKPRHTHPHLALKLGNLQVLCSGCNRGKGGNDRTDWR